MLNSFFQLLNIKHSPINAFFLGVAYSLLGIITAIVIFPAYAGIVSVFFTAIALMPSLQKLTDLVANSTGREQKIKAGGVELTEFKLSGSKLSFKNLWNDYGHIIQVYFYSFIGVFIVYSMITLITPTHSIAGIFGEQATNISGQAFNVLPFSPTGAAACDGKFCLFEQIVSNNLWVLFVSFAVSLIYGAGSTFIITWNASVWGVAFASFALQRAPLAGSDPFVYFALIMLTVLPHTLVEAMTYFTAAIGGGILSIGIAKHNYLENRFNQIVLQALILLGVSGILLLLGGFLEVYAIQFFATMFLK